MGSTNGMNEVMGYLKYGFVGMILSIGTAELVELLVTGVAALVVGFAGALGGFIAKLVTNRLKRTWPKLFKPDNDGT